MVSWQYLLCLSQSHQGSRSQYSSLAHASTQGFAEAPGFFNEVLGSPYQSPHRGTEALREERKGSWRWGGVRAAQFRAGRAGRLWKARSSGVQLYPQGCPHRPASGRSAYLGETEGYRVAVLHKAGRGHTQSHGCIHQPRPVQVDPGSIGVGQKAHLGQRSGRGQRGRCREGIWTWHHFLKRFCILLFLLLISLGCVCTWMCTCVQTPVETRGTGVPRSWSYRTS